METIPPTDFYGHTLFCDDIRQEASGKITFVGVYTDRMVVHGDFPLILPKFALWIQYNQRRTSVLTPVEFAIFLPGDKDEPSLIVQVPEEGVQRAIENANRTANAEPEQQEANPVFVDVGNHTVFSPFVISEPGIIMVRAIREDKLVRLGALRVIAAPTTPATS
jgi:hypothetical protein